MEALSFNVADLLDGWASKRGWKEAVVDLEEGRSVTYAELSQYSSELAAGLLKLGLRKGDRVAVLMENSPALLEVFYACSKAGLVFTPLSFRWSLHELEAALKHCSPRALIGDEDLLASMGLEAARRAGVGYVACTKPPRHLDTPHYAELRTRRGEVEVELGPEDPHALLYTAGTMGRPKACLLPYRKTFFNVLNDQLAFSLGEADRALCALPLFHSGGLFIQAVPTLSTGGTLLLMKRVRGDAERLLSYMEDAQATWFLGVAYHAKLIASHERAAQRFKLESMRFWAFGGEPIPCSVIARLQEKWPHIAVAFCYGSTETSLTVALPPSRRRVDSYRLVAKTGRTPAGWPMYFCQVKLSEDGELLVRGPVVFKEYLGNPEASAKAFDEEGWYRTGDLAVVDEEGLIYVVDRVSNVIKSGGEKILASEVEEALLSHPAVEEAVVIGVADEKWGERPVALVALRKGSHATPDELRKHCLERLAKFKTPDAIIIVDELPRSGPSKVSRAQLRELLERRLKP